MKLRRKAKTSTSAPVQRQPATRSTGLRTPGWTGAMIGKAIPLQRQLTVNQSGDVHEQEADRVATQVMTKPFGLQRAQMVDEEKEVQTKPASGGVTRMAAPASVHQTINRPGQPLDSRTRAFMEPRFGRDFSDVRIHTDTEAAQSAADVNARAYTVGQDVVFGHGEYHPGSGEGDRLIAHELVHVEQQKYAVSRRDNLAKQKVSRDLVIPIVFPDYRISTPFGRISQLGHAGVLLINGHTGMTAYFEYGRYDRAGLGEVRRRRVPDIRLGRDGLPTETSLQRTLQSISLQAGHRGRIQATRIEVPGQFRTMHLYAQRRQRENSDSSRTPYSILNNNCMTFAQQVAEAAGVSLPRMIDPRPNSYIEELREKYPNVDYTPPRRR